MRPCRLLSLALAGLLAFAGACRADKPRVADKAFEPTAVLRLAALDDLAGDARYLAAQAQRKEGLGQIEEALKKLAGGKGLRGVDGKKPLGAYATLAAKVEHSQVMVLLPIADQKEFLAFLKDLDLKAEKGDDGAYKLLAPGVPFPILFRFAHGYVYATMELTSKTTVPAADKLPSPEVVLAAKGPAVSLKVDLGRVPEQMRKVAVSAAALYLGNLKDEAAKGETEKQREFREACIDELTAVAKQLLEQGGPVSLDVAVDQKKHDLSVSLKAAGKPDTALAKRLARLGRTKSLAALIGKDSALGGFFSFSLPKDVVKPLGAVVDEGVETGLELLDEKVRKQVKPLADLLAATAKTGSTGVAVDLRGPSKKGRYAVVAGVRVKDGDRIEEALKKVIEKLPDEAKKPFGLDAHKVEGVNVHRVDQANVDEKAKELFGDGPAYFALTKDALIITLGEDALAAMKGALAAKPKAAGSFRVEASLSRLAPLLATQRKGAVEAAKAAFVKKGSDKVTLSVKGGEALEVKLRVKTQVLTFAAKLDEEEKKQDAESEDEK